MTKHERIKARHRLLAACDEALARSERGYDTAELAVAYLRRAIVGALSRRRASEPHDHPRGFACLACASASVGKPAP